MTSLISNRIDDIYSRFYSGSIVVSISILLISNNLLVFYPVKCFFIALLLLLLLQQSFIFYSKYLFSNNIFYLKSLVRSFFNGLFVLIIAALSTMILNYIVTVLLLFFSFTFIILERKKLMYYILFALSLLPTFLHLFNISQNVYLVDISQNTTINLVFLIVNLFLAIFLFIKYDKTQSSIINNLLLNNKKKLDNSRINLDTAKSNLKERKEKYLYDKKNTTYKKNIEKKIIQSVYSDDNKSNKEIIVQIIKNLCNIFNVYTGRFYLYNFKGNLMTQNIISEGNISIIQPQSLDTILQDCIYEKMGNTYYYSSDFISYSSTSIRNIYHKGIMVIPLVFDGKVICILTFFSPEKIDVDINTVFETLQYSLKPFILKVRESI